MKELKFYYCDICGNIVIKLADGQGELVCCGEPMVVLQADDTDAALEKHVPFVEVDGNKVKVVIGEVEHPMTEKHFIEFITLVQGDKIQTVRLSPEDEPKAEFLIDEGPFVVYEHCNIHGLWKKEC
ncbi:MAG: desulfoferrodoxin [Tissierellia bacterium]|nr:desulfoferrodoxin [Tissierellia bacterium]